MKPTFHKMNIRLVGTLILVLFLISVAGCAGTKEEVRPEGEESVQETIEDSVQETIQESATETTDPVTTPPEEEGSSEEKSPSKEEGISTETESPSNEPVPITVSAPEDIKEELYAAICAVRKPAPMEISGVTLSDNPDIDVKNLYHELMRDYPDLKYAYDITAKTENGFLLCEILYMPYKTGNWPANEDALTIHNMTELLQAAEENIGAESVPIRLMEQSVGPDDMNRILAQVGGGYILCVLNRDGTEITYTPALGMDMEECLSLLDQADKLAEQIIDREVNDSMTQRQKAEALYTYLTGNVKYDQRYYSDRNNMPYDSQTAIGALRDNLAICGGYSLALKLLFEKVGIPCYYVTGSYYRENHMWCIAYLDGEWLWFDATSDRGASPEFGFRRYALKELDTTKYRWEQDRVDILLNLF